MLQFTLYTFSGNRPVPDFEFVWCETVEEAVRQARLVLVRDPEIQKVEVFDGAVWRETVSRGGAARQRSGPPSAPA